MHIWTAVININNAFANVRAVTSGGGKWGFAQVTWHGAPHGIFSRLKKNWGGGEGEGGDAWWEPFTRALTQVVTALANVKINYS